MNYQQIIYDWGEDQYLPVDYDPDTGRLRVMTPRGVWVLDQSENPPKWRMEQ